MAVKVIIRRTVPQDKEADLLNHVMKLRLMASQQSGYVSGETLRNVDNPDVYMVISTWQTISDWDKWYKSSTRHELQRGIDELLGEETRYEIYHYPEKRKIGMKDFI